MLKGTKHTPESIEKMRKSKMGQCHNEAAKAKMAEIMRLRWADPEERERLSAHKSESLKARWADPEQHAILEKGKAAARIRIKQEKEETS